ncbi:MAG: hypothetical protein LBM39_02535 [Candidatus Methanoplasma sp.]|jgi:hypothetical protein|nr:hypothetical protein [Candidatus Methanoplasma sp.]
MSRINKNNEGIATIIFVAIVVIIIAAAGAALYVALADDSEDDCSGLGFGIGSEFVYRSADGGVIRSEVVGDSPDRFVLLINGESVNNVYVILNKSDGTVSWGSEHSYYAETDGDQSWKITADGREIELTVKKSDDIYNISDLDSNGEKYVLSDSTIEKHDECATDPRIGEKFVYTVKSEYTVTIAGESHSVTASGTYTLTREAIASYVDEAQNYIFSSELILESDIPGDWSKLSLKLPAGFEDVHSVGIFDAPFTVSELVGITLPGDVGEEKSLFNGPDGAVSVTKNTYILAGDVLRLDAGIYYETLIGPTGIFYKSHATAGSEPSSSGKISWTYDSQIVYSHHEH